MATTSLQLNGQAVAVQAEADTPLLWLLRGELGLTGTKYGCGIAQCGACTVLIDGEPARGCVTPLAVLGARALTTIEGLSGREADAVRAAWVALDVVQCGYCQSGQVLAATALLRRVPSPDDAQIDAAMTGNVCRCGTYPRIRAAIHAAARALTEASAAAAVAPREDAGAPVAAASAAEPLAGGATPAVGAAVAGPGAVGGASGPPSPGPAGAGAASGPAASSAAAGASR